MAPWPSSWSSGEALTARLDSRGYQVDGSLRPRVEGAGRYSSNSLPQLPAVERLLSAKHEVWILGPQTPVGGRRATRVDEPAAWGVREHARAPPSPSTLCALSAQAIHAAQGEPGREGRGWYPLWQLEEELDPAAR